MRKNERKVSKLFLKSISPISISLLGAFALGGLVGSWRCEVLQMGTTTSFSSSNGSPPIISRQPCELGLVYRKAGFPALRSRDELGALMNTMGFETGAEVGVQKGGFSKVMLTDWKTCTEYHLIDVWAQQENYVDGSNVDNAQQQAMYEETQSNVAQWPEKAKFHRMLSLEAAKDIADHSLDFVYVDARHDYCGCMEDMRAYWPKLRPGGIMAGHDYITATEQMQAVGLDGYKVCMDGSIHEGAVRGAVEEFAAENSLIVSVTYSEPHVYRSWITQKPTRPECVV